ncbi:MAG: amino acid ABC transporter permease [Spirochaetaceae bacterium]|nr:amino acid ABC transporter permease [Spirochaetaceae bacterium]
MGIDLQCFNDSLKAGIQYIPNTLSLVFFPLVLGLIIGTILAYIRFKKIKVASQIIAGFVTIYRGVPVVVALLIYNMIFLLCYGSWQQFFHWKKSIQDINLLWIAVFALTLAQICGMEEVMRSSLLSIDKGQWEAAKSIGMKEHQLVFHVIIPQLIPAALPHLTNLILGCIKNSSIVVAIGVVDIMVGCTKPAEITYMFFEAYLAAALIYWVINIFVETALRKYENYSKKFRKEVLL